MDSGIDPFKFLSDKSLFYLNNKKDIIILYYIILYYIILYYIILYYIILYYIILYYIILYYITNFFYLLFFKYKHSKITILLYGRFHM